jgi:hypothetical protein
VYGDAENRLISNKITDIEGKREVKLGSTPHVQRRCGARETMVIHENPWSAGCVLSKF